MDLEQVFSWTPLDTRGVVMAVVAFVLLGPVAGWAAWMDRKAQRRRQAKLDVPSRPAVSAPLKAPFTDVGVGLVRDLYEQSGAFVPGSVEAKEEGGMVVVTGTLVGKIGTLPHGLEVEIERGQDQDIYMPSAPTQEIVEEHIEPMTPAPLSVEWGDELKRELVASGAVVPGRFAMEVHPGGDPAARELRATVHLGPPRIDEEKLATFAKGHASPLGVLVIQPGQVEVITPENTAEKRKQFAVEERERAHLERAQECYRAFREEAGKVDGPLPEWKRLNEYERRAWVAVAKAMEPDPYW